jgi:hypothetical protein
VCYLALNLALVVVVVQAESSDSRPLRASMVELPGDTLRLREVLAELEKTGNRVEYRAALSQGAADRLVAELPKKPTFFWSLVDYLAAKARLDVALQPAEGDQPGKLCLTQLPATAPLEVRHSVIDGPFKLIAAGGARGRDVVDSTKAALRLCLLWEPKYDPIWMRPAPLRYRVGRGAWQQQGDIGTAPIRLKGQPLGVWSTHLNLPPSAPPETLELQGEIEILASPGRTKLTVQRMAPNATASQDGIELAILDAHVNAERREWTVRLLLKYPQGSFDLESHQVWALGDLPGELADAGPNPARYRAGNPAQVSIDEGRGIRLTYLFRDVPPRGPNRLSLSVPARPVLQKLPFTFAALPIR